MKKVLFYLLLLVLAPIAVLIIITPMDSQKQYIFGFISLAIMFVLGFSKKHSVSIIMMLVSVLMSTRYIYFRATQTLHFNSEIEAILGIGLFLAELFIWVILLLSYLQTSFPLKRGITIRRPGRLWTFIFPATTKASMWYAIRYWLHNVSTIRAIRSKSICSMTASGVSLRFLRQTSAWVTSRETTTRMPKPATSITP